MILEEGEEIVMIEITVDQEDRDMIADIGIEMTAETEKEEEDLDHEKWVEIKIILT